MNTTLQSRQPQFSNRLGELDLTQKALEHPGDLQAGWWALASSLAPLFWVLHEAQA